MKREHLQQLFLGVVGGEILLLQAWLAHHPSALLPVLGVVVNALIFAAYAWLLVRFGPTLLRESPLATRRMVAAAFAIGVGYVAIADKNASSHWLPLFAGASIGLAVVFRRTHTSARA